MGSYWQTWRVLDLRLRRVGRTHQTGKPRFIASPSRASDQTLPDARNTTGKNFADANARANIGQVWRKYLKRTPALPVVPASGCAGCLRGCSQVFKTGCRWITPLPSPWMMRC